ncbi:MAG TPA: ATP-binding protein [Terracidiphilus sp.]|nr:ATP-binding protein [Terracidiphilus sp.]
MVLHFPSSETLGRWPWFVRFALGCFLAMGAVTATTAITQLRHLSLILVFPTVILGAWFLGMSGAVGCALMDVVLVNWLFARSELSFYEGNATQLVKLATFFLISLLLSWSMLRLSQSRATIANQELERKLQLAESDRRLAEERAHANEQLAYRDELLQIALKASGMGLWVWDLEKNVVHRSDELYRMAGRDPEMYGPESEEWLQLIHADDLPTVKRAIAKARADGTDFHMQYRVCWPDGSIHWLESHGRCQRDEQGKAIRIFGVQADITQRKQSEEAMLRTEKLAVAGRLAASVAHEINNPLEAVANLLYLISISDSLEQSRIRASSALDELMRISLVAQSTLKFHKQTGMPKATLLSEILNMVLSTFRGRLRAMEITVDLKAGHEYPIACMPSETQQIFANLVANSIEAMQRNGCITIRIHPSLDWRNRLSTGMRVTIRDNGTGIERAMLRHIFEPFFTTKAETGTGLGLWVVQQLVERHNGSVRVWSSRRPGASGTAFSVFLPFGEAQEKHIPSGGETEGNPKGPQSAYPDSYSPGLFLKRNKA